ncbi:DUF177 domain-containing protein [Sharpea porci]|uniref:YceD family protein n=1 Tax=Sharpea porci TaxID=2652286 RepID=UPI00240A45D2|nr:DUF177 domain-containing protein [Sharpea porci]MDD6711038.1 DUF177 domain-containing protein [Sharpea porci]MDY5279646.1 DUF177 domain-containing protein [Sharpea porci]
MTILKWNKQWLQKQKNGEFDFEESLTFPEEMFYNLSRINGLKDVEARGHGRYDIKSDRLYVDLHVKGTMIVPCAISLEDVDYPFEIHEMETFAFYKPEEDEEVIEARKNVADLTSVIWTEIMMEVPMRVVKEGATMKRNGQGWQVLDEEDLEEEDPIDPRLAKLKDYFKDK